MKKNILAAIFLGAAFLVGTYDVNGIDGNGRPPFRWRDYLPSRTTLQCYLTSSLAYAARSYQQAVLASLAMAGDSEAIRAWQELMATYNPSELMCMMGGQGLDQLASGLSNILPVIPGMTWVTRRALETALYRALESVRIR